MKITIETPNPSEEEEIIIRCHQLSDGLLSLIYRLKQGQTNITAYEDKRIVSLNPEDIYYFESVDNKTFAYCEKSVFEVKSKLYEIEDMYSCFSFLRISKSAIVNVEKIISISPMLNGRLEAKLKNGEKTIISRQYVPDLKKKLGIAGR